MSEIKEICKRAETLPPTTTGPEECGLDMGVVPYDNSLLKTLHQVAARTGSYLVLSRTDALEEAVVEEVSAIKLRRIVLAALM